VIRLNIDNNEKVNCIVCGAEVEYLNRATNVECYYCGIQDEAYFCCVEGHYVCNKCHTQDALDVIKNVCLNSDSINPFQIAEKLMDHHSIHMHGPEHHALIPAVLITAYQNFVGQKSNKDILEAIKRGKKVPGGYCGLYGACGGGIGVGIAVSILLEASPLTPGPRSHANWATSKTLKDIADAGGARCCKKSVRIALEDGIDYLSNLFDIDWSREINESVKCNYSKYNKECDSTCKYKKDDFVEIHY
jgi:hypothetical protein